MTNHSSTGMTDGGTSLHVLAELSDNRRKDMVEKKITCPFLGSAVQEGLLSVRGDGNNPLASIAEVRKLGNSGGGDLGDLLVLFAKGNHSLMRGPSGKLTERVPADLFSLELPGSQGSHPGHSGILETDPNEPGSGKTNLQNFQRLANRATQDGLIRRSDIGRFIGENLARDPNSKVAITSIAELLARDVAAGIRAGGIVLREELFGAPDQAVDAHRDLEVMLTKLLGEDNLVGSAGEFGLLMAFLTNSPRTVVLKTPDGEPKLPFHSEPALSLQEVRGMFIDKRLPVGWDGWKKSRADWVIHTTALVISAGAEYRSLKK